MKIIVAVDSNWGIGKNNDLLTKIPEDMSFFKTKTINNIVVMGRNTFESLPHKKPLKNRLNFILSRNKNLKYDGIQTLNTVQEVLNLEKEYSKEVFIIGGGQIYDLFLPYCERIYVTKIYRSFEADVFFQNIDISYDFKLDTSTDLKKYNGLCYNFNSYVKK